MTFGFRILLIAALLVIGLGMPVASTAPSPGASEQLAMVALPSNAARVVRAMQTPEDMLLDALTALRAGDTERALEHVDNLVEQKPTFRLAHLVRGDILASIGGRMPNIVTEDAGARKDIERLMAEARQRVAGTSFEPGERVPAPLLQLADHHRHAIYIDTLKSRLYVFANNEGDPKLVGDYYISIGKNGSRKRRKGDKRTPLGVYVVTERLPGESLPDKYGPVAFPVDYPNAWDRRHQRTGSGIWLHGVASRSYSRPPQDSDGCVALINEELQQLSPLMEPGKTPVVIGEGAEWVEYGELLTRRAEAARIIEQWRYDWESGDVEKYLSHYDDEFVGSKMSIDAWRDYKRRVNKNKTNIAVELNDISIFGYPDEDDLMVVTFKQHYESNNFNGTANKRQYWRRGSDNRWRIVNEDLANRT
ncbi:MAG: L,D-transpeptidase family protein [Gammaproteobacteria bacterium]